MLDVSRFILLELNDSSSSEIWLNVYLKNCLEASELTPDKLTWFASNPWVILFSASISNDSRFGKGLNRSDGLSGSCVPK